MGRLSRIYFLFFAVTLLFSCNFEKRLYRNGYYVSHSRSIKNTPAKTSADLLSDTDTYDEKYSASAEAKIIPVSPLPVMLQPVRSKKPQVTDTVKIAAESNLTSKKKQALNPTRLGHRDDEATPKDVKYLFWGSVGALIVALFYGFFLGVGSFGMAGIAFILIPFSVIGLWIYALLLSQKYSHEDTYAPDKKESKERVYSQRKAFLLAGFLGIFGAHRFYLGYPKLGLLEMCTLGGFFILFFVDMIRIKRGKLKPFDGIYVKGESTYTRGAKQTGPNKALTFVMVALGISLIALLLFLGFAIWLAPSLI